MICPLSAHEVVLLNLNRALDNAVGAFGCVSFMMHLYAADLACGLPMPMPMPCLLASCVLGDLSMAKEAFSILV